MEDRVSDGHCKRSTQMGTAQVKQRSYRGHCNQVKTEVAFCRAATLCFSGFPIALISKSRMLILFNLILA